MFLKEIISFVTIIIITTLVISLFLFITAETNQKTTTSTITSESADTQIIYKQDSDQTKEMSNPTYVTNNYTYNSTGGDFLSDLSINVIAELIAAFILGFLGNKIYSKIKLNKQKG